MTTEELFQLYVKEREYQTKIFGDFKENPNLNIASFLEFIRRYLNKADDFYADKWTSDLPLWMLNCKEIENGSAPILTYENLIKVFALAGAALETFALIDPSYWRAEGIKKKWLDGKEVANE
jgi:hypothetical protein